jgi:hypothetical protein
MPDPTPEERIARARARRLANERPDSQYELPPWPKPSLEKFSAEEDINLNQFITYASRFIRQFIILTGAIVLFASGASDVASQSKGAISYEDETSFLALQLRSLGYLKIGIALLSLGFMPKTKNLKPKKELIARGKALPVSSAYGNTRYE